MKDIKYKEMILIACILVIPGALVGTTLYLLIKKYYDKNKKEEVK